MQPIRKYTLPIFLERAKVVHGNKYDYSQVTEAHINNGAKSKIPVKCNICEYDWNPSITTHINNSGCPSCAGVLPWTLERVKIKVTEVHGNKYDHSYIQEFHINGVNSPIPVKCNTCQYEWWPTISNHIRGKGCPNCAGNLRWTLERFKVRAKEIHEDKCNYSLITEQHIVNQDSYVPIICNICFYQWSTSIMSHINMKSGCLECAGVVPWNLERFLIRGKQVHGYKYNYSEITENHIAGKDSHVPIECNVCQYKWRTSIHSHINSMTGCPDCAGVVPWTLERFKTRAANIHGDKHNYSHLTEEDITGVHDNISIKCNGCLYQWITCINSHINRKQGCPDCAGRAPWTADRVKERAIKIHKDKYDYSLVTEEDIVDGCKSRIPVKCNTCKKIWSPSISNHISHMTGCPNCCIIGYSQPALTWLKSIEESEGILIQCATSEKGEFEVSSPNGGKAYKADGYYGYTNTIYEYYGDYWHGNPQKYNLNNLNKTVRKTYGELYQKTIERENYLKSLGYNLVIKWETPFDVCKIILSFDDAVLKLNAGDFLFLKFLPEYQVIPHDLRNHIATFYGKDGNIYLVQLQYNQQTHAISHPL